MDKFDYLPFNGKSIYWLNFSSLYGGPFGNSKRKAVFMIFFTVEWNRVKMERLHLSILKCFIGYERRLSFRWFHK